MELLIGTVRFNSILDIYFVNVDLSFRLCFGLH